MELYLQLLRSKVSKIFYASCYSFFLVFSWPLTSVLAQGTDNILTIPSSMRSSTFVGSGNFNAIIFGNHDAGRGDTEGRLAVGGNFSFNAVGYGYSVGLSGPGVGSPDAPDNTDNFVVNGNFNNVADGWQVRGNFVYNTATNGTNLPTQVSPGATYANVVNHIKFSELLTHYKSLSATLDNLTDNGVVAQDFSYEPITLTGTAPVNIFNVTIPAGHNSGFTIDIPNGSTAIVNVTNTTVSINGGNMIVNTSQIPNYGAGGKVLFNFPHATNISLQSFGMLGSFLAPFAELSGNAGSINGQTVIGGNVTQAEGFEFHNFSFLGDLESVLPVTLLRFKAQPEAGTVSLAWTTTSESNSSHFDIERSANGRDWSKIGTVSAQGESRENKSYFFSDAHPLSGENVYRLKMTDLDGTFAYSRLQSVRMQELPRVSVYPNPVSERIFISNPDEVKQITLADMSGRMIYKTGQPSAAGIDCKHLSEGLYLITLKNAEGILITQKILIAK